MNQPASSNVSSTDASERRVCWCVEALLDDQARQCGALSHDDVNRVLARKRLTPNETALVWQRLRNSGIAVADPDIGVDSVDEITNTEQLLGVRLDPRWNRLLTHEEEIALGRRVQAAEQPMESFEAAERERILLAAKCAREELLLRNLRLVIHNARKFANNSCLLLEDLIHEGIVGLMRAIDKFEPERGFRFSTYATWWITQAVMRAIAVKGRMVRLPDNVIQQLRHLKRKQRRLAIEFGRSPNAHELGRELGIEATQVRMLQQIRKDCLSLDEPRQRGETPSKGAWVIDHSPRPEEEAELSEFRDVVAATLDNLDKRSRKIVAMRFGLEGQQEHTLEELGVVFGVTRERIRQIEAKAIERLQQPTRSAVLAQFLPQEPNPECDTNGDTNEPCDE